MKLELHTSMAIFAVIFIAAYFAVDPNTLTLRFDASRPDGTPWEAVEPLGAGLDFRLHPLRTVAYPVGAYTAETHGALFVERGGRYTFNLPADRHSTLQVDGRVVWERGTPTVIDLPQGLHRFALHSAQPAGSGPGVLSVWWQHDEAVVQSLVPSRCVFNSEQPALPLVYWSLYGRTALLALGVVCAALAGGLYLTPVRRARAQAWLLEPRVMLIGLPLGLLLVGLLARGSLLLSSQGMLESDEASFGLLALDILDGRNYPWAFHYGQPYQGVLEGYLLAGLFAVFGAGALIAKLLPLLWASLAILVMYHIGRRLRGPAFGALAAGYLALPPVFLSVMSLKVWFGYLFVSLTGLLLLYGAVVWVHRHTTTRMMLNLPGADEISPRSVLVHIACWAAAGLLAGLSLWTYPLVLPAVLAALLVVIVFDPRVLWLPEYLGTALLSACAGLAPALLYNMQHNWASLSFLQNEQATGNVGYYSNKLALLPQVLHVLLGAIPHWPWPQQPAPDTPIGALAYLGYLPPALEAQTARYVPAWVCVLLIVLVVAAALWRGTAHLVAAIRQRGGYVDAMLAYLFFGALLIAVYIQSHFGNEAHYLVPLYPVLALLFADTVFALGRIIPVAGATAVVCIFALHLAGHLQADPMLLFQARHLVHWGQLQPTNQQPVVQELQKQQVPFGIAGYWTGDRITFDSHRSCIYTWWWHRRYPGHPDATHHPLWDVAAAPRIGYLFHNNYRDTQGVSPLATLPQAQELFSPDLVDYASSTFSAYTLFKQPGAQDQARRRAWQISACARSEWTDAVTDGCPVRGWSTPAPRQSGDWLAVDCTEPLSLRRVVLLHGKDPASRTGPGRLEASADGYNWQTVAPIADHPTLPVSLASPAQPVQARFWRIVAETNGATHWDIRELYLVADR